MTVDQGFANEKFRYYLEREGMLGMPTKDRDGRVIDTYFGVPLAEIFAAFPPPLFETRGQVHDYLRNVDVWIYRIRHANLPHFALPTEQLHGE